MTVSITKCLIDWGLDKVFTITVDNASSNDTTVKELSKQFSKWGTNFLDGSHLHVRCVAHIINLIVQDGLKEVGDSVKRVRQAIRFIRQSPARIKRFKDCCEIEKIEIKKSLCLDVPTRWNSTYLMLNTTQEFENAFARYAFLDPGLLDNLLNNSCEDGKVAGAFTNDDWMKIRHMVKFLETFYDLTLRVSGSLYVTSNVHFQEIGEVSCLLRMLVDSDDIDLSFMAERMKAKFDKYWGAPEKMNKMIFVACVLDRRFKFEYVSFVLLSMYGEEKGEKMRDDLKLYVISLYDEYRRKTSKESHSKPPASASNTFDMSSSKNTHKRTLIQQEYLRHRAMSGTMDSKSELDKYLDEETKPGLENFDILLWWKVNSPRFLVLAEMARDVLAIPISTVASDSAFSTRGRVLDPFRSSLTPKLVQALLCAQDWLRHESLPITVEEDLDKLEKFENDMASLGRDVSCITDM
ncbi:zinc finger BED domain-containing protein RICESLEEPER 2-like [Henckelia pumila]|uniref:zinc finger BED domain-containing protein RICESLEEPER 2-like n=1 Tax=Henckelia pumila TaxID=405737 RepID=UPI003C6E6C4A